MESRNDRIWLRVAAVKVSKNRARDRVKLERARPSFLVHFPGEPYFYAGAGLREEVGEAVAGVLGCQGWERLPLDGHQVDSLRRMRLGRDARDGPVRARPGKDARFGVAGGVEGAGGAPPQPLVEKGTFRLEGEFKGREALVQPNLLEADVRLGQVMTVSGKDIVTGLLALAAEGVFDSPAPLWLTNFPTAGRNQVSVVANTIKSIMILDVTPTPCSSCWTPRPGGLWWPGQRTGTGSARYPPGETALYLWC